MNGVTKVKFKAVIVVVLVVALVAIFSLKEDSHENYAKNSISQGASLIEEAKKEAKPVWLLFHSTTCQSCTDMEEVFLALKPEFEEKVAFIKINVDNPAERELCYRFNLQLIPTTYFLNAGGELTFTQVGIIKLDEMRSKLKALAE